MNCRQQALMAIVVATRETEPEQRTIWAAGAPLIALWIMLKA
jgi:hypothetical protein